MNNSTSFTLKRGKKSEITQNPRKFFSIVPQGVLDTIEDLNQRLGIHSKIQH